MPKSKNEATKKHGDKLEPLIESTETPHGQRDEGADDDREQIEKEDRE